MTRQYQSSALASGEDFNFAVGKKFNAISIDSNHPVLRNCAEAALFDQLIFNFQEGFIDARIIDAAKNTQALAERDWDDWHQTIRRLQALLH